MRPTETDLRPVETDLRPVETDLRPVKTDLGVVETDLRPTETDLRSVEVEDEGPHHSCPTQDLGNDLWVHPEQPGEGRKFQEVEDIQNNRGIMVGECGRTVGY